MRKLKILAVIAATVIIGCSKGDNDGFDGSLRSIEDFYTPELVRAMDSLGFTINTGNKPPEIEGVYDFSPVILQASSVPGDILNSAFLDYEITFSNQNNGKLTIDYYGDQGAQIDDGAGSFISGKDNTFSVFLIVSSEINSYPADSAIALSGKMTDEGITDIQLAFFMLDNKGNPGGNIIHNNTGRIFYDSDGLSEKITVGAKSDLRQSKGQTELNLLGGLKELQ